MVAAAVFNCITPLCSFKGTQEEGEAHLENNHTHEITITVIWKE